MRISTSVMTRTRGGIFFVLSLNDDEGKNYLGIFQRVFHIISIQKVIKNEQNSRIKTAQSSQFFLLFSLELCYFEFHLDSSTEIEQDSAHKKNCYLLLLLPTMFSLESFLSCPTCSFSFVWTFRPLPPIISILTRKFC